MGADDDQGAFRDLVGPSPELAELDLHHRAGLDRALLALLGRYEQVARPLLPAAMQAPSCRLLISMEPLAVTQVANLALHGWDEAMARYGSDKPDLRNPLELTDIADLMREVEFKVFVVEYFYFLII